MRLTRVFVSPAVARLAGGADIALPPGAGEHVARVLRLRVGDALTLFDGRGGEWSAQITAIAHSKVRARCLVHQDIERESPLAVTLLQSLARGEKMDWVVQKATELGVQRIQPVSAERSVVQIDDERAVRRLEHWQAVAAGACEQCGRNRLPRVDAPLGFAQACLVDPAATRLVLDADAGISLCSAVPGATAVVLLIGPEGGLTDAELALTQSRGFVPVRFGPRILRTETAAVAAIAALQVIAGDYS